MPADLRYEIHKNFNELNLDFLIELKDQIKELESPVSLLQKHVKNFQKQLSVLECKNEELEQYSRRLYLRTEGVPPVENESSDDVLDKMKSIITESRCEIPDVVIDRAYGIGKGYKVKTRNVPRKNIIRHFCRHFSTGH